MKKQRIMIMASALAIMTMATMTAFGAGVTEKQARDLAEDYVPAGSTYYKTKNENTVYEIKFYNEKKLEKYEVEISKESLKLISFESEKYDNHGSSKVSLTEKQAKNVVTKEIEDAKILSCKLDTDDGYQEYDVYFTTDSYSGKYTIHAENGTILERDIKAGARQSASSDKELLSIEKIKRLSEEEVSGGTITDIDLDEKNGSYVYEVETYKDGIEYELVFDAVTGRLLWSESDTKDWSEDARKNGYWHGYDDDDWDDDHEHRYDHDDDWDDDDDDDDDDWDDDDDYEHHYEKQHESGHHGHRD